MNDQQNLAITSAGDFINRLHGGLTLARRGTADPQQLPTVYSLTWCDGEPQGPPQDASPSEVS